MDIVSSASAVVGIIFSLAKVIKTCSDVQGRYQHADCTVNALRHELEILQAALQELANLMMHDASALSSRWDTSATLPLTFKDAVLGFQRTIASLEKDFELLKPTGPTLKKSEKINLLWNDDGLNKYKDQIRGQSNALNLLLQVLQT
ncbi:uncharacterized protein LY89DRAFT_122246 [Mollisia scopiformis]|uniref:Fungal N-terminal domain-containing protein n=1 Tax=Mollisia scopiformis TaxID=149040 RepID=A0A194X3K7_MOLSC|nr:uncharacterized protein LY89DRAFT_122246 [Mollisia scopiformis]KUJ14778.1 hypothetical protein LY89DRAFT_122246 [Mollisia scopiformis]